MITEELEKCIWFNKTEQLISTKIPYFDITKTNNNKIFFNDIIHHQSESSNNNNFKINKLKVINYEKVKIKLMKNHNEMLLRNENKEEKVIKSINTKFTKKIDNYKKIIKTRMFQIYPNTKQQSIIHNWMKSCVNVYNECINLNNLKEFNLDYTKSKLVIFNKITKNL